MKLILNFLAAVTVFIVAPFGIVLLSVFLAYFYWVFEGSCKYYDIDVLPSPTGRWSVARAERRCFGDENTPPMMLALLPSGAPFRGQNVFLTSADYEGVQSQLSIFAKWVDDDNLVVAAPEGGTLRSGPGEFNSVHVQYAFYPVDPNKTRDEPLRRTIEKKVHFESDFGMDHGVGVPGVGCHLTISAHDGEYLDKLSLYLTARMTFAIGPPQTTFAVRPAGGGKAVMHKAYSSYDFQVLARDKTQRPGKYITGASVVGFAPSDDRPRLWAYHLNYPRTEAPNGEPMPKWFFGYTPKDPHDLLAIARRVQDGTLAIQASFWLDNDIVVFTSDEPGSRDAIDTFELCIRGNRIFETPPRRAGG